MLPPRPAGRDVAVLLTLALLWGSTVVIAKLAVDAGTPPLGYSLWQGGIAAFLLLSLGCVRGRLPPCDRRHLRYYAISGLLGLALPDTIFFLTVPHLPAGVLAILISFSPLFTYAFALALRDEGFSARRGAGLLAGLAGAMALLGPGPLLGPGSAMAPAWMALALATPFFYALSGVLTARAMPVGTDPLALSAGMSVVATLAFVPIAWATGSLYLPWPPTAPFAWPVIYDGVVSALAFFLYFGLVRRAGAVFVSQVGYLVLLFGLVLSVLLLGEAHGPMVWAGAAAIAAGIALVSRSRPRGSPAAAA